jgi:hypothetical protein
VQQYTATLADVHRGKTGALRYARELDSTKAPKTCEDISCHTAGIDAHATQPMAYVSCTPMTVGLSTPPFHLTNKTSSRGPC